MAGISVDLSGVYRKLSTTQAETGRYNMAQTAHRDMNENFVPLREGNLRMQSTVSANGKQIIWNSVYARRHYYATGNWNYTTAGTGPRWDEKAKGVFMSRWLEAFKRGAEW